MAVVIIRSSGRRNGQVLRDRETVTAYLKGQGMVYESWGVERLNGHLKRSYVLCHDDQQKILSLYVREISDLKSRQGYLTEDIVVLSDETPNLDAILEKFRREHHHTDDEVRFVVDGSGIFTIRKNDLIFDVTVRAGDLLVVPAYTRHWFDLPAGQAGLTSKRRIKCIRIFKDPAGWVAIYDEPTALPRLMAQESTR